MDQFPFVRFVSIAVFFKASTLFGGFTVDEFRFASLGIVESLCINQIQLLQEFVGWMVVN